EAQAEAARREEAARAARAEARAAQLAAERAAAEARAKAARDAAAKAAAEEAAREAARREAAQQEAAREAAAQQAAADEAAAQQAAAQQAAAQEAAPAAPAEPVSTTPSSSSGVSAVIAFAQAQLGEPYVWGGEGPGIWDCSGLTMMAWRQAGVYMSHYTGAQWAETQRVPLSDLRPGDLVFYGSSGASSHHVGLYVGNGQMIEAPHSGAVVRYASIYRSDLLPYGGRP
ncbi:MAG: NlpC/P60 family protein, partial [Micrococcales bacterium]|nr:NlpC/P60 family protein [Micrococcales bacterium]